MTDSNRDPGSVDGARNQARNESSQNMGPANTYSWDNTNRTAYENERAWIEKQKNENK